MLRKIQGGVQIPIGQISPHTIAMIVVRVTITKTFLKKFFKKMCLDCGCFVIHHKLTLHQSPSRHCTMANPIDNGTSRGLKLSHCSLHSFAFPSTYSGGHY